MTTSHLACDLGAESGRLILGVLTDGQIQIEELCRFPNVPVQVDGALCWDIPRLYQELERGLKLAGERSDAPSSISTDSWGVDYVFVDSAGNLMEPAFHYRDSRSQRGVNIATARIPWESIFNETGIQFMPLNTIFQLATESPERLARAGHFLMVADAFNYWLSGTVCVEESNASTSQLYSPHTRTWSDRLINALELPRRLFPPVVPSGTRLGRLKPAVAQAAGLDEIEVIASCSHDTGAAVAAVPALDGSWAYLSSGTWSLMGVELPAPVITEKCRELNFTNEIGWGGSVRLLKNISGLWLVQECRRAWAAAGRSFDYSTLTDMAAAARPFVSLIDPTDPQFIAPNNMPDRIAASCRATDQPVPEGPGPTIRCILESLALLYWRTLRQIEQLIGTRIERLHVVGGGSRNGFLNQLTADVLEIPVRAGPVEATALGNVLVQALALGRLTSLENARALVARSFPTALIEPQSSGDWGAARRRFEQLCED